MSKSISEALQAAMIATGLGDREISRQTGVSQPQISAFRKGSNPKASTLDALARWLGYTLVRTDEPKPKTKSGPRPKHAGRSTPTPTRKRGNAK